MRHQWILIGCLLGSLTGGVSAGAGRSDNPDTFVIRGATVLTVSGEPIEAGSVLVRGGKIAAVGKTVDAPAGTPVVDARGMYLSPGIIDCHSHNAIQGGVNEATLSVTAMVGTDDVVDPEDVDIYRDLAGGVTSANLLHGSANAIGGRNQVVKYRWGADAEGMKFKGAMPGIKFALGENPKRAGNPASGGQGRYPATRMGVEDVIRDAFNRARAYTREWQEYESKKSRGLTVLPPRKNLELESLSEILQGKRLVHCHCYRADEIFMMIRLADEFGFKIATFQHVLEGYKVAKAIAAHGAGGSTFSDWWAYKIEAFDAIPYNAAIMTRAGVVVSINSDSAEEARHLNQEAAKCIKYGSLTENEALRLVTLNPAKQLRIDKWVGSIETGKDADLALFNAHPLSAHAMAQKVWIDGRLYFDRERDRARLKAVEEEKERLQKLDGAGRPTTRPATRPTLPAPALEIAAAPAAPAADAYPAAEAGLLAIRNARVYPVSGPPLERATVLVENGRIKAVGADVAIPSGAKVIEGAGLRVYPGMIDATSTMGLSEIGSIDETQDTNENQKFNPQVRAYEAIHPESEQIPVARVAGVTTTLSLPRGGTLAGQPVLINLDGATIREMSVLRSAGIAANLPWFGSGLARRTAGAAGADPRREYETRMKELADLLDDARHYWQAQQAGRKDASLPPVARDERLEALLPLVRRQVPLFAFAATRPSIRSAVEFAERQKLRLVLVGADEAGKLIDFLKGKDVAVIYAAVQTLPANEDDPYDLPYSTPALLAKAGIPFAIATDATSNCRNLPFEAGTAAGNGLSDEEALKAVTLYPARILGAADRLGSIEPGKIANLVITDGDLLEIRTNVRQVIINGRAIPMESRHTRLWEQYRQR
ncbi:MAG: amidohydrolase, imidazolonepropionase, partial [Armatimonadetes bacterium]|nr:amidohydrolase, imidazolonepropionase [Armatimonadota bacterium]